MKVIKLKIVTPEKIIFSGEVKSLTVSTTTGDITILPNHIPLISQLAPGEIIVNSKEDKEELMAVSGGFVEVFPKRIVILADTAERAEEIDEKRAEEAYKKAEDVLLKTKLIDNQDFSILSANISKELARLRVAKKYRKRGIRATAIKTRKKGE